MACRLIHFRRITWTLEDMEVIVYIIQWKSYLELYCKTIVSSSRVKKTKDTKHFCHKYVLRVLP